MEKIVRPDLTKGQKAAFKTAFEKILSESPVAIQKMYIGEIVWVANLPYFENNLPNKLQGKLADKYLSLLNKVKGRNMEKEITLVQYIDGIKSEYIKLNHEYITIVGRHNYQDKQDKNKGVLLTEIIYSNPSSFSRERIYVGQDIGEIRKIISES